MDVKLLLEIYFLYLPNCHPTQVTFGNWKAGNPIRLKIVPFLQVRTLKKYALDSNKNCATMHSFRCVRSCADYWLRLSSVTHGRASSVTSPLITFPKPDTTLDGRSCYLLFHSAYFTSNMALLLSYKGQVYIFH